MGGWQVFPDDTCVVAISAAAAARQCVWLHVAPGNEVPVVIALGSTGGGATAVEAAATVPFEVGEDQTTVGYFSNARAGGSATISILGFEEVL